jgi:hypothetical protein
LPYITGFLEGYRNPLDDVAGDGSLAVVGQTAANDQERIAFGVSDRSTQRELLVSNPLPIPYQVDVADGTSTLIGDAATIIRAGFDHWLPLIHQLGVLAGTGREDVALRDVLTEEAIAHLPPDQIRSRTCQSRRLSNGRCGTTAPRDGRGGLC